MVDDVDEDGISARVVLDPETDRYVIECSVPGEAEPFASLRVPRAAVERAVLDAISLALELGPDGTVMAYAEEAQLGTLVRAPLVELVRRVVGQQRIAAGDQLDPVTGIMRALEEAVQVATER